MTKPPDWSDPEEIERRFEEGARELSSETAKANLRALAELSHLVFGRQSAGQPKASPTPDDVTYVAKHAIGICWRLAAGDPKGWRDLPWLLQCARFAGTLSGPEDRNAFLDEFERQSAALRLALKFDSHREIQAAATAEIALCLFTKKSVEVGTNNGLLPASKIKRNLDSRIAKLMHKSAAKSPEDKRTCLEIADRLQTCRALLEQNGADSRGRPTGKTENFASAMMSRAMDANIHWVNSLTDEETSLVLIMSYTKDTALAKSVAAQLRGPQSSRARSIIAQLLSDLEVSTNGDWNPDRIRKELLALFEPGKGFAPGEVAQGSQGCTILIESLMACDDIFSIVRQDAIRRHAKSLEQNQEPVASARAVAEENLATYEDRVVVRRELKVGFDNYWRRKLK